MYVSVAAKGGAVAPVYEAVVMVVESAMAVGAKGAVGTENRRGVAASDRAAVLGLPSLGDAATNEAEPWGREWWRRSAWRWFSAPPYGD